MGSWSCACHQSFHSNTRNENKGKSQKHKELISTVYIFRQRLQRICCFCYEKKIWLKLKKNSGQLEQLFFVRFCVDDSIRCFQKTHSVKWLFSLVTPNSYPRNSLPRWRHLVIHFSQSEQVIEARRQSERAFYFMSEISAAPRLVPRLPKSVTGVDRGNLGTSREAVTNFYSSLVHTITYNKYTFYWSHFRRQKNLDKITR